MLDVGVLAFFGGLLGACVGSFLNVVIYRLPIGESLVSPPSHCPACGSAIRWYDNVPILGWLVLRGRCRDCGVAISSRYAIVEAITGLLGAALAGTAIENSMLGAAHSAANPLTAHFNIVHGQAVGMMLPAVVRFNAKEDSVKRAYAELASGPEIAYVSKGLDEAVDALVAHLEELLDVAGFPASLKECGVEESSIPTLAAEAEKQWTANFNPRPVAKDDFAGLFRSVFAGR